MRWTERWMGIIVPAVAQRVVSGKAPQPGWLPRRWVTVVSGDADPDAGCGAVWLVWRPGSAKAEMHTALVERCGGRWRCTGGSSTSDDDVALDRPTAGQPGQVGMIEFGGGAGGLSLACRLQHPDSVTAAPWIGASELRVAAEVDHLLVGGRRIEVPGTAGSSWPGSPRPPAAGPCGRSSWRWAATARNCPGSAHTTAWTATPGRS
jgi:hypothetical protein